MADEKFQRSAFVGGNAQFRYLSAKGCRVYHHGAAFGRWNDTGYHKVRIYDFVNYNIRRAGFGNIRGQILKQIFQIRVIRRNCHMRGVRIRCLVI